MLEHPLLSQAAKKGLVAPVDPELARTRGHAACNFGVRRLAEASTERSGHRGRLDLSRYHSRSAQPGEPAAHKTVTWQPLAV